MSDQAEPEDHLQPSVINFVPQSRVTAPDATDWHLVADHELNSIAQPEGGILGAIGFAALGAALGALPAALNATDAIAKKSIVPMDAFRALVVMLITAAAAIICLVLWGVQKYRTRGIVARIRARPLYKSKMPITERPTNG